MFQDIVGSSETLRKVLRQVTKVALSNSTVLILGETGTGKELIARAIHKRSNRAERAFIGVNCAAIPPSLIASELFGHEKGAFTGATQRRLGRFESANGGTIFLDEVAELRPDCRIPRISRYASQTIRNGLPKPITRPILRDHADQQYLEAFDERPQILTAVAPFTGSEGVQCCHRCFRDECRICPTNSKADRRSVRSCPEMPDGDCRSYGR